MQAEEVGKQRYRASYGRYFEEFTVGDIYEHRPGRTITEADNIHFSLLTMNFHPMHCDAAFAAKSEFGQLLVNSGLTVAIVLGMSVNDVSGQVPYFAAIRCTPNRKCLKNANRSHVPRKASSLSIRVHSSRTARLSWISCAPR
jgi:hypothetical protein